MLDQQPRQESLGPKRLYTRKNLPYDSYEPIPRHPDLIYSPSTPRRLGILKSGSKMIHISYERGAIQDLGRRSFRRDLPRMIGRRVVVESWAVVVPIQTLAFEPSTAKWQRQEIRPAYPTSPHNEIITWKMSGLIKLCVVDLFCLSLTR